MTQKELNERIAMSLLMQCAWMWEYCTQNPHDGEFSLTDVVKGLTARNRYDTKPGCTMVKMTLCERWEHFADRIDGLKYFDRQAGEVTLDFGDYRCQYVLTDVFKITSGFCRATGCSSLANKTVFGCEGDDRYCRLPSAAKTAKKSEKKKEAKVAVKQIAQKAQTAEPAAPLSIADRLRAALRARLAA